MQDQLGNKLEPGDRVEIMYPTYLRTRCQDTRGWTIKEFLSYETAVEAVCEHDDGEVGFFLLVELFKDGE